VEETTKRSFAQSIRGQIYFRHAGTMTAMTAKTAINVRNRRQTPRNRQKIAYLSRHLARRERFDDKELGLQRLAARSLLACLDEVEMQRIALKSRVRLEAPRSQALFSSQYLCGSSRPNTCHVIHEISIQDVKGNWIRVKALIDCGATSIFASPKLIEILGLQTQQAHTTTYGLDGNVMSHTKDSRKMHLSVSYFEHEQPVDESEVLIVRMTAYDLVLG
jgi:hypothetical protein